MIQLKSMEFFRKLLAYPRNELIENAMREGRVAIGYTCSYVPEVLLSVGKLFPVRMRAPGVFSTELADNYLSTLTCSYVRSILESAMDGGYDFISGWVFAASCDHLRRLYDNMDYLTKPSFNYILDVPHRQDERAVEWHMSEIRLFIDKLYPQFDIEITEDLLKKAIREHNEFIKELKSVAELRKMDSPYLTGTEFHAMLMSSQVAPRDLIMKYIRDFKNEIELRGGVDNYRARLMVVGSNIDDPEYIAMIESQGGIVVADRFCTGSIPGLHLISEEGDPLLSIARHGFAKTDCPRMMDQTDRRIERIIDIVKEYNVDGVIVETIKFCDLWGIEAGILRSALRDSGIPVLKVDREYRLSGEGQLKTRIQAFLESMKR